MAFFSRLALSMTSLAPSMRTRAAWAGAAASASAAISAIVSVDLMAPPWLQAHAASMTETTQFGIP